MIVRNVAIVTGAAGYIGNVLCKILKEQNTHVIGIDNNYYRMSMPDFHQRTRRFVDQICIGSYEGFDTILKDNPDATIYHLAASSLIVPGECDPLGYFNNNVSKMHILLQAIQKTHKLIFASSAAVYGENQPIMQKIKETSCLDPSNVYGKTKLWGEQLIDLCYVQCGIRATSFRFFNVIGAYKDAGQQKGTPHIIPRLCEAAVNHIPFILDGANYPTADGTCIRDYIHVEDICRAMIHASDVMDIDPRPVHHKYNLGYGYGWSNRGVIDLFNQVIGRPVSVVAGPPRRHDPAYLVADGSRFSQDTGFIYNYYNTPKKEIIDSAWRYFKR